MEYSFFILVIITFMPPVPDSMKSCAMSFRSFLLYNMYTKSEVVTILLHP